MADCIRPTLAGPNGNPAGNYWTASNPSGPVQAIIDFALRAIWGNPATIVTQANIPAGTTIFQGAAAPQAGLVGGGTQIYIPNFNPAWIVR